MSNDILTEYMEKCVEKYGAVLSNEKLDFLLEFSNVELTTPYFHWNLIEADPEDNKFVYSRKTGLRKYRGNNHCKYSISLAAFVANLWSLSIDCALAGKADYLVTHDRHFNALSNF